MNIMFPVLVERVYNIILLYNFIQDRAGLYWFYVTKVRIYEVCHNHFFSSLGQSIGHYVR